MQFRIAIRRSVLVVVAALPLLSGCGESADDSPTPARPATEPAASTPAAGGSSAPAKSAADASKSDAGSVTPPDGDNSQSDALKDSSLESSISKPSLADYKAPFPDRVELFVAPKRLGGARTPGDENQDAVELLGFVNVDRSKVVLSINGQVTPAAEGETQLGVEVISIQPPTVVLQRGRQRWSASLEN